MRLRSALGLTGLLLTGAATAEVSPYLVTGIGTTVMQDADKAAAQLGTAVRGEGFSVSEPASATDEDAWLIGFGWEAVAGLPLELTYADLGRVEVRSRVNGALATGDIEARALSLTALPSWQTGPLRLFARAGVAYWGTRADLNGGGADYRDTAYGGAPTVGAGLEYHLGRQGYGWALRLGWSRYLAVGDDDSTGSTDIDLTALSLVITP